MNYLICYECRSGEESHQYQFEISCDTPPQKYDQLITEKARKDSIRFVKEGSAGISIISIEEINQQKT